MLPQSEPSVQQWFWVVQDYRDCPQDLEETPQTDALLMTPGPASEQISDLLFNRQAGQRERLIGSAERGMGVGSDPVIF